MKTKSSPSRYRYCMSERSTMASPTSTPALNVFSTTPPVFRLRSLVRTNAPPLPGLHVLELDHLEQRAVEVQRHPPLQLVGGHTHRTISSLGAVGISARAVLEHLDHVLDPDAAHPVQVDPRLDGHRRRPPAGRPCRPGGSSGPRGSGAHPVPQAVVEGVVEPRLPDDAARGLVDVAAGHAGPHRVDAGLLRRLARPRRRPEAARAARRRRPCGSCPSGTRPSAPRSPS